MNNYCTGDDLSSHQLAFVEVAVLADKHRQGVAAWKMSCIYRVAEIFYRGFDV